MKNKIMNGLFLVVLIFGIVAFSYWSYSKTDHPDIIMLGNPANLTQAQKSSLPTAYRWVPDKRPQIAIDTTNSKDPRAYFVIDPENNNIDEIIEWSKTSGKAEIYIRFNEPPDPDANIEPYMSDIISGLYQEIIPVIDLNWSSLLFTTEAWAANVPGPGCSSGTTFPSGTTRLINCNSYGTSQQRTICANNCPRSGFSPSMEITYNYEAKSCHIDPMTERIWQNVDNYPIEYLLYSDNHTPGSSTPISNTYCMSNSHNSGVHYCQPSGLEIQVYKFVNQFPSGTCGSGAWGCANTNTGDSNFNDSVATSKDGRVWIAQNKLRNNGWLIRHEVQHTYGFFHGQNPGGCADMSPSGHDTFHCCNNHKYGFN